MKIMHRVELGSERVTVEDIRLAVARFEIPQSAYLFESEESYDIVIEWEEMD